MTVIWGLSYAIMAALTVTEGRKDYGVSITCPNNLLEEAKETYCTFNITKLLKENCTIHHGKYIFVENTIRRQQSSSDIRCRIDLDTGECLHEAWWCPHCHTYRGGTEARVYLTKSLYDGRKVKCWADCGPEFFPDTPFCHLDPPTIAAVTTKGPQDRDEAVRTVCPSIVEEFPVRITCRLNFSKLKGCMGRKRRRPQFRISQDLEMGTNTTGFTRSERTRLFEPSLHAEDNEVHFYYEISLVQHGAFTARCFAHCPSGLVRSQSYCRTTFILAAYPYEVTSPGRHDAMELQWFSRVLKLPFAVFCKVNVTKLEEHNCFMRGVGEHEVVMTRSLNSSGTPPIETTTCKISNIPGVPHICHITPECPVCRQQGKDQFYIGVRYTRPQSEHETFSCSTWCYNFTAVSNQLGVFFTPGNGDQ